MRGSVSTALLRSVLHNVVSMAEQLRNDVVRDTRKWRGMAARAGEEKIG